MGRERVKALFVVVPTTLVGGLFGSAAPATGTGIVAGALSGACVGRVWHALMRRSDLGKLPTFLSGSALGALSGLLSGAVAHLPSHLMGRHGYIDMEVGALFGLFVGAVLGALLSPAYFHAPGGAGAGTGGSE